jgi:chemotaxis protein histidine kinase CheA
MIFFLQNADDSSGALSPEVLLELKAEAQDLLESLGFQANDFIEKTASGAQLEEDAIGLLFRTLHTIKGLSQMANQDNLVAALHSIEDRVGVIRENKSALTTAEADALAEVHGCLTDIFEVFPSSVPDELLEKLNAAVSQFVSPSAELSTGASASDSNVESLNESESDEAPAQTQGTAETQEVSFEASPEELASLVKFQSRAEGLYACVFDPGQFADVDALTSSDIYDNLSRVCDFIALRAGAEGAMIVLAAELDESILESVANHKVYVLSKGTEPCGTLPDPWSVFFFGFDSTSVPEAAQKTNSNGSAGKQNAQSKPAVDEHGHDDGHEEEEDFDAKNLGPNASSADLPELDVEMLQDFLSNADDLLEELAQSLLTLESAPDDKAAIDLIFRDAHTIKGTSGMFGFRAIERVCHIMENMFDNVRKGKVTLTSNMVDALFAGLDRVRAMFESLKKGGSSELPINEALAKLKGIKSPSEKNQTSPKEAALNTAASETTALSKPEVQKVTADAKVPSAKAGGETEKKPEGGGTIKVDLKRLDFLVNLVGELVIDRSRFARIEEQLRINNPGSELSNLMSESILLFSRHMNEVQSVIMKIRMVPVGNAFNKFTRVVRDLSKQINKEIDLVIEGADTELDKTIVEEIGDPLVHLIRNSVDHGIELPEDREKAGKPRKGVITLTATQDGNMIVITVKDDGKGLQVDRIRAKAIATGLIKEADNVPDKDIFNLIFEAGFSTADKVTNISGRGVGMDVVKKNIVKLKGIIELDSAIGKGTTTTIKLPLTLAIIPSLMVGVKGESYAVPLTNVVETIRMDPKDVQTVGNSQFVKLRDQVIPLLHLTDAFSLQEMADRFWYRPIESQPVAKKNTSATGGRELRQRIIFVVIGVGEKRIGLVVDSLMGQQEIVIKSLGKLMGRQRGVAGGCVLGNGRVAIVLDASEVIDDFSLAHRRPLEIQKGGNQRAS